MPSITLTFEIKIPFIDLGLRTNAKVAMQIKKFVTTLIKQQTNIIPIKCEDGIEICSQQSELKLLSWKTDGV